MPTPPPLMPDVAKLKKKAAEFELKKQFDKALAVYVEILESFDPGDEEVDVSLYNRVGDLYLKQGSVGDAVDYYEQAVDRYAEGGFHNNAIALCNKILRNSPGRASVYYKLGRISAQKGFKGDAKKNYLEYADRMQSAGKIDEAFRALKEFADLCPDQDDIRLMLADQLSKKGRSEEAIEQLQQLYERYTEQGRDTEARAAAERMKSIDPTSEPRVPSGTSRRSADDLVFLDLSDTGTRKRQSAAAKRATLGLDVIASGAADTPLASPTIPPPSPARAVAAAPAPTEQVLGTPLLEPPVLDGVSRVAEFEKSPEASSGGLLEGLETTSFGAAAAPSESLLDLESTSLAAPAPAYMPPAPKRLTPQEHDLLDFNMPGATPPTGREAVEELPPLEPIDLDLPDDFPPSRPNRPSLVGLPMLVDEDGQEPATEAELAAEPDVIGGDLELIMPDGTPARGTPVQESHVDDLPLMDLELPIEGAAPGRMSKEVGRNSAEFELTTLEEEVEAQTEAPDRYTPPPAPRQSTVLAEQSVELLAALSEADPDDNALRRRLAEAMLESGDREGGLRELETAMLGFERADDLAKASKLAEEIVLLNPDSVRHHQKRVEYAFRTNERGRLIEAYLQLAEALFRAGQVEKSRAIYQRVMDLAPDDLRAAAALESFPAPEPPPEAPPPPRARATVAQPRASVAVPPAPVAPVPDTTDGYINLGDWLRDDEAPKDTRMVVEEKEPTGDEEADFQDMLRKFKEGIAENVEDEDHQSHYDLGVAYKEMGLLDEAIAEFQKALRAPSNRVPTYEALGQCFMEKEQYPMASTVLGRALHEPNMSDDNLVGVLYLLGRCAEERGQRDKALEYYQRVFVVDIQFRDVADRLAAVEGAAS